MKTETEKQTPNKKEYEKAIFEILELLDEKITKLTNRFDRLAEELGYKV